MSHLAGQMPRAFLPEGARAFTGSLRTSVPKDQVRPPSLWKQSYVRERSHGSNQVVLENLLPKRKNSTD